MSDANVAELGALIGDRVRSERQARSWTLDRLADRARVSRRMLINVEQGTTNPSIATLLRISDALGVGLPALVAPPEPSVVRVSRRSDRAALWTGSAGSQAFLVAGSQPPDVVELWDWALEPGDEHTSDGHARGTNELLFVLSGTIELQVDGHGYELDVGDAASFPGEVPHAYRNPHDRPARFALTVFQPGVGEDRPDV